MASCVLTYLVDCYDEFVTSTYWQQEVMEHAVMRYTYDLRPRTLHLRRRYANDSNQEVESFREMYAVFGLHFVGFFVSSTDELLLSIVVKNVMCNEYLDWSNRDDRSSLLSRGGAPMNVKCGGLFTGEPFPYGVDTRELFPLCMQIPIVNCNIFSMELSRIEFTLDMVRDVAATLRHSRLKEFIFELRCKGRPDDFIEILARDGLKHANYLKHLKLEGASWWNTCNQFTMVINAIKHPKTLECFIWSFGEASIMDVMNCFDINGIQKPELHWLRKQEYMEMTYDSGGTLKVWASGMYQFQS